MPLWSVSAGLVSPALHSAVARGGKVGGGKTAGNGARVVAEQGVESRLEAR